MQQTTRPARIQIIDLATLHSRQRRNPQLVLVEALPGSYYASGHLPRAFNLPHDSSDADLSTTLPDRQAPIVTYCASATCPNSHVLAQRLAELGYENVAVFADGKIAWREAGLSFET